MEWEIFLADKITTFVSIGIAWAFMQSAREFFMNILSGMRLRGRGFNFGSAEIYYKGKLCVIENIGLLSTQLWEPVEQMECVPIPNSVFFKQELWRKKPGGNDARNA